MAADRVDAGRLDGGACHERPRPGQRAAAGCRRTSGRGSSAGHGVHSSKERKAEKACDRANAAAVAAADAPPSDLQADHSETKLIGFSAKWSPPADRAAPIHPPSPSHVHDCDSHRWCASVWEVIFFGWFFALCFSLLFVFSLLPVPSRPFSRAPPSRLPDHSNCIPTATNQTHAQSAQPLDESSARNMGDRSAD